MSRAAILDLVGDMIAQGADRVTPGQRQRAVDLALIRYSADRPLVKVEDVVSDGSDVLPYPLQWTDCSALLEIETPVGRLPISVLDADTFMVYQGPAGDVIRLARVLPEGQTARLRFTVPHVLTDTTCTIPPVHHEAVACYAAACLCEQISTSYADASAPTIAADSVDQKNPAREWATRANRYRTRYFATLGIPSSGGQEAARPQPAGAVANMELAPSWDRAKGGRWLGRRR